MRRHTLLVAYAPVALLACVLALIPAILVGCSGGSAGPHPLADTCSGCSVSDGTGTVEPLPSTVRRVASFAAFKPSSNEPTQFYSLDGKVLSPDEFSKAFAALPKDSDKSIGIHVLDKGPATPGQLQADWVRIGCLWMDVRWEWGYIPGCIKRVGWHLNFHIKDACTDREIFNLHAAGWRDNGPQFGLYESARGWCWRSTGTWTAIRDKFMGAFAAVGITGFAAYVLSDICAGVCVGAFAF